MSSINPIATLPLPVLIVSYENISKSILESTPSPSVLSIIALPSCKITSPITLANDENVTLRNFGIRATEANILGLSQDQRTFTWASNGRKLMNVPFDENPYSALAAWFKTDEGVEVYKSIEKKFK